MGFQLALRYLAALRAAEEKKKTYADIYIYDDLQNNGQNVARKGMCKVRTKQRERRTVSITTSRTIRAWQSMIQRTRDPEEGEPFFLCKRTEIEIENNIGKWYRSEEPFASLEGEVVRSEASEIFTPVCAGHAPAFH